MALSHNLDQLFGNSYCCTRIKLFNSNLRWTITNFAETPSTGISSRTFPGGYDDKIFWLLHLSPNGIDEETSDYVSVHLVLMGSFMKEVRAKFRFAIVDADERQVRCVVTRRAQTFSKGVLEWGAEKLIKKSDLFDPDQKYLANGSLTILCEVSVANGLETVSHEVCASNLNIPDERLFGDMLKLFHSGMYTDVVIACGEEEFRAHKAILCSRSAVFAAMFDSDMRERRLNRVEITDIEPEVISAMLHFIYSGTIGDIEKIAIELLIAADKYGLERLKLICEEEVYSHLCPKIAAYVLVIADFYSAVTLKAGVICYINSTENTSEITATEGWKKMAEAYPHLIDDTFELYSTLRREYLPNEEEKNNHCISAFA